MIKRLIDFVLTGARQAVPVGGIFGLGWQPPVAVAVYWVESVLLVAIAVLLCVRVRARTSDAAIAGARAEGDDAHAEALLAEAQRLTPAGVSPFDVLVFHGGSMAIFGVFFASVVALLTVNGHVAPIDWAELRYAAGSMAIVLAFGFAFDSLMMPAPSVAVVQARVNACLGRWALMWLLGFGGLIVMAITGRPLIFFQVFAVLKTTWEVWGWMARTFGWKSLQEQRDAGLA